MLGKFMFVFPVNVSQVG